MIPSEKYFKKILGFEKASTGGGGPLGGAIGRGLAMDGLGRLAGIGPAGRNGGKGGSNDGSGRKPKLKRKNKPNSIVSGAGEPAGGGLPLGSGVPQSTGSGEAANKTGGKKKQAGNGRRRPATSGAPGADGNGSLGRAFLNTGKRKIARAITGGQYDYMNGNNGSWKAAGKYIGRGAGRMFTRGLGVAAGGALGLTVGAASAMATGDINNLWKGTTVGIGAGNKLSSNMYDRGADFIEGFGNELQSEHAKINDERNATLRTEDTYKRLDEDLSDLSQDDYDKFSKDIDEMAEFVNFDSMKDVKAMHAARAEVDGQVLGNTPEDQAEAIAVYNDAHGYQIAGHEKSYLEDTMRTMGVTDESVIKNAVKTYMDTGSDGGNPELQKAIVRMRRVKAAQKEL